MRTIIIFAGTTEGRELSEFLCNLGQTHIVCIATEYGMQVLKPHACVRILQGRMDAEEMRDLMDRNAPALVVDATHPYAELVKTQIRDACEKSGAEYIRLGRFTGEELRTYRADSILNRNEEENEITFFENAKQCAEALKKTEGAILLTTGSKDLDVFCEDPSVKERLVVRVLPGRESLALCERQEIPGKRIIAMQGPFSEEMNLALIRQYGIRTLVTKASGKNGGFDEKLNAVREAGISACIIGIPPQDAGKTFGEVCELLIREFGNRSESGTISENSGKLYADKLSDADDKGADVPSTAPMNAVKISLIGCGMGQPESLTLEAVKALQRSEIVFGSQRLLDNLRIEKTSYPYYLAKDILPELEKNPCDTAILFSGDTGFFSGCRAMKRSLEEEIGAGRLKADIRIYPGISSLSALAAKVGENWEHAKILSIHGRGGVESQAGVILDAVRFHESIFILLSGAADLRDLGELLDSGKTAHCRIIAGYQMDSPKEELLHLTPARAKEIRKEGLYAVVVKNPDAEERILTTGLPDQAFERSKVPMTKEEIRTISISKMHLTEHAVVYDIGSGTGSISVEIARLHPGIRVFALEKNPDAIRQSEINIRRFGLRNVSLLEANAPDGLEELPPATHAFIGGSGGNLLRIIEKLLAKNRNMRIVVNAISYETLTEIMKIEQDFSVTDFALIQVSVSRTRALGAYHMSGAENPVWICSFTGQGE